ncbi:MAG: Clp protease ClpP [Alphaproteobacteria bacterium]|nr:Clp protease ClpP [Alphaproteobacteria bacterium]
MSSWYEMRALAEAGGAEITIYDEIGKWGIRAADFFKDLKALGSLTAITLRINSPGGDVFDGLAIHNMLRRHQAKVTASVDGVAASMASVVLMAADVIEMPDNAMIMIHDPSGGVWGTAEEMRDGADMMDKVKANLIAAYRVRAKVDDAELHRLMSETSWISAAEALKLGFADKIEKPVKLAARFDPSRLRGAPQSVRDMPRADGGTKVDPPKPKAEPVGDIEKAKAEARAAALAYVREVNDLCALARAPTRAAAFITAETPLADIRRLLVDAGARGAGDEIHNHLPDKGREDKARQPTIDVADVYAQFNNQKRS